MAAQFRLTQQVTRGKGASSWRTGQGWLTRWTPAMVAGAPDPALAFAEYSQQLLGIPWPTAKDQVILRARVKQLFEHYPRADYFTLCRLAQWCKTRKKRLPRIWMLVDCFRAAWAAGALPELDPQADEAIDDRVARALEAETGDSWRQRLLCTTGTARQAAIEEWEQQRWPSSC